MTPPNRERKNDIKFNIELNAEQKEAKKLIVDNQIVIVTGSAGTGKSLICAQAALDFLMKKQCESIFVTRATIEVGKSLGFLPGGLEDKFNPYLEALIDNLYKCKDKPTIDKVIENGQLKALPLQFIRGKTIESVLIVEESQNLTKGEVLAILTRLGKSGKIIFNGDNNQQDTKDSFTGLSYLIELSKVITEIKWKKLIENHRSDLVAKILEYEYKSV
jgi:phosphate starvation-inducible PhoH-like protein